MTNYSSFQQAFVQHIERTGKTVAEIARETGIGKGQLDKLRQGRVKSTNVDDAIKIADYFGQSVNAFCNGGAEPARATGAGGEGGRAAELEEENHLLRLGIAKLIVAAEQGGKVEVYFADPREA